MKKLFRFRKLLTFAICCALTMGAMSATLDHYEKNGIYAQNKAELEQQKKQNQSQIDQLEKELQSLQSSKDKEKAYQETLSQQIAVMEENINIVEEEMCRINSEIITAEDNINTLNDEIAVQEVKVSDNTEVFKQRLKAMYVTGNDSLATAVLGSTDFYDMISRVEMVNKIADHDSELIENLKNDIDTLETSKNALETEKLTLEMKQEEQKAKKEELDAARNEYIEAVKKSEAEVERLKGEMQLTQDQIAERQDEIKKADAEIDAILKKEAEAAAKEYYVTFAGAGSKFIILCDDGAESIPYRELTIKCVEGGEVVFRIDDTQFTALVNGVSYKPEADGYYHITNVTKNLAIVDEIIPIGIDVIDPDKDENNAPSFLQRLQAFLRKIVEFFRNLFKR